jgi:polyhydroxyalkanoate synthesis regulator phasin
MRDALRQYLAMAGGLVEVTKNRATPVARALVAQGEATRDQVSDLVDDLITTSKANRDALVNLVGYEVERSLGRIGVASADEVKALTSRVRELERAVKDLQARSGRTAPAVPPATPKTVAKAAEKAPAAKKAAAKKAAGKKAAEKAPAAKKAAKKAAT